MTVMHVVSVSTGRTAPPRPSWPWKPSRVTICASSAAIPASTGPYLARLEEGTWASDRHPAGQLRPRIASKAERAQRHRQKLPRRDSAQRRRPRSSSGACARCAPPAAFLDLCIWKAGSPSRKGAVLHRAPEDHPGGRYQMGLIDAGLCDAVWSLAGCADRRVRARRTRLQGTGACVVHFQDQGRGIYNYRPICAGQPMTPSGAPHRRSAAQRSLPPR